MNSIVVVHITSEVQGVADNLNVVPVLERVVKNRKS